MPLSCCDPVSRVQRGGFVSSLVTNVIKADLQTPIETPNNDLVTALKLLDFKPGLC